MLQHPITTAALVEQRQADLRRQAEQARLIWPGRLTRRARRQSASRWRLAQRTPIQRTQE